MLMMLVIILFDMLYCRGCLATAGRSLEISCPNEGRGLQRCWCLFPTCQVRVSRFWHRCNSSFFFRLLFLLLLLLLCSWCAPLAARRDCGFQWLWAASRGPAALGHAWISTLSPAPDAADRELWRQLGTPGPEHMPERLPDRTSEHMPNRTECQNRCQKECQKACQKECQKACQKECQNIYIYMYVLYIYIYIIIVIIIIVIIITITITIIINYYYCYYFIYTYTVHICHVYEIYMMCRKLILSEQCVRVGITRSKVFFIFSLRFFLLSFHDLGMALTWPDCSPVHQASPSLVHESQIVPAVLRQA